jgi:hypothetical protein
VILRPQPQIPNDRWLGFLRFLIGLGFLAAAVLLYVDCWWHQPPGVVLLLTLLYGQDVQARVDPDAAPDQRMDHRTEVALAPWSAAALILLILLAVACWQHYPTDVGVILAALLYCLMEMVFIRITDTHFHL